MIREILSNLGEMTALDHHHHRHVIIYWKSFHPETKLEKQHEGAVAGNLSAYGKNRHQAI
jgi:hypothetical protein